MIPVLQTTFPHLDAPAVTQLAQDLAAEKYGQGMPKVDNGIPVIDGGLARCLHDLLRLEPVDAHHAAQTLGSCGIHDLRFNF